MAEPAVPGDTRFFARTGPHSRAAIAAAAAAEVPESPLMLTALAPLAAAAPDQVSFIDNRKYAAALAETRADIKAGRFVKESPAAHVKRVKKSAA